MKIVKSKKMYRWGPIPGCLINVDAWISIFLDYPSRPHHYIWPEGYEIFHDGKMLFVNEQAPLEKTGSIMFRQLMLTSKYKKFEVLWHKRVRELFLFTVRLTPTILRSLPTSELVKSWERLNVLIYKFWEPAIIPEMCAYGAEAILKKELAREPLTSQRRMLALSYLSAPTKFSFYQEEELAELKVAKYYGTKDFQRHLVEHHKKYFWIANSYGAVRILPLGYFRERISILFRRKTTPAQQRVAFQARLTLAKKNYRQALAWVQRNKLIKQISDGLIHCIWRQDQRKELIFKYLHYLNLFVDEFARRNQVKSEIYRMAWHWEVSSPPTQRLIHELKSRRKLYVIRYQKDSLRPLSNVVAKQVFKSYWQVKIPLKQNILSGTVVFPATQPICGRVFIVRHHADLANFPEGSILVTTMTAPEYITAIRKAKAIVADEGGLTCHAAIVSRELGIPCVVGTQVATQVLKTGDKVLVDATHGIIKKI